MADPHPCITFQVNLQTVDFSSASPSNTFGEENIFSDTRSTWLPLGSLGGRVLKHGEKFTICGIEATRAKNLFTTGDNPTLVVCEGELDCVVDIGAELPLAATATTTMVPVGTASAVAPGSGYSPGNELTLVGGTSTETGVLVLSNVKTILDQDETNYSVTELNGTFTGGESYLVSSTITMSDGTVVLVDAISGGAVTEFHITTISSTPHTSTNDTITQSFTSAEFGSGFSMTIDVNNQGAFTATPKLVAEVPVGEYTVIPSDPVSTTGATPGGATFNVDWGVKNVAVVDGGNTYTEAPAVSFSGGSGTTAIATLTGDSVSSVTVTAAGSGHSVRSTVTIANP